MFASHLWVSLARSHVICRVWSRRVGVPITMASYARARYIFGVAFIIFSAYKKLPVKSCTPASRRASVRGERAHTHPFSIHLACCARCSLNCTTLSCLHFKYFSLIQLVLGRSYLTRLHKTRRSHELCASNHRAPHRRNGERRAVSDHCMDPEFASPNFSIRSQ